MLIEVLAELAPSSLMGTTFTFVYKSSLMNGMFPTTYDGYFRDSLDSFRPALSKNAKPFRLRTALVIFFKKNKNLVCFRSFIST